MNTEIDVVWLQDEMARIGTRLFHVVGSPASEGQLVEIESKVGRLPFRHRTLLKNWSQLALFRGGVGGYKMALYSEHIRMLDIVGDQGGVKVVVIGVLGDFYAAYVHPMSDDSRVIMIRGSRLIPTNQYVDEWLRVSYDSLKKRFSKREWAQIEKGPLPFSPEENAIVAARKLFKWRFVGCSAEGKIQVEVFNGSDRILPFLSLGVKSKTTNVTGGIWINVSKISPGEQLLVVRDAYRGGIGAQDIELFDQPDPIPETKDRYWEFK